MRIAYVKMNPANKTKINFWQHRPGSLIRKELSVLLLSQPLFGINPVANQQIDSIWCDNSASISQRLPYCHAMVTLVAVLQVATAKVTNRYKQDVRKWDIFRKLARAMMGPCDGLRLVCPMAWQWNACALASWRHTVVPAMPGSTLVMNFHYIANLPNSRWLKRACGGQDDGQEMEDQQTHGIRKYICSADGNVWERQLSRHKFGWHIWAFCWIFHAEVVGVEVTLAVVTSLRSRRAAFGQAGSTRVDSIQSCGSKPVSQWFPGLAAATTKCKAWNSNHDSWSLAKRCVSTRSFIAHCNQRWGTQSCSLGFHWIGNVGSCPWFFFSIFGHCLFRLGNSVAKIRGKLALGDVNIVTVMLQLHVGHQFP